MKGDFRSRPGLIHEELINAMVDLSVATCTQLRGLTVEELLTAKRARGLEEGSVAPAGLGRRLSAAMRAGLVRKNGVRVKQLHSGCSVTRQVWALTDEGVQHLVDWCPAFREGFEGAQEEPPTGFDSPPVAWKVTTGDA